MQNVEVFVGRIGNGMVCAQIAQSFINPAEYLDWICCSNLFKLETTMTKN